MSKDGNKDTEQAAPPSAEERRRSARRRLLKGAAAAPVIYTLHSGSALASRSIRCDEPGADGSSTVSMFRVGSSSNYRIGSPSGPMVQSLYEGDEFSHNGQTYRFDGVQGVTGSCWASVNPIAAVHGATGKFV